MKKCDLEVMLFLFLFILVNISKENYVKYYYNRLRVIKEGEKIVT